MKHRSHKHAHIQRQRVVRQAQDCTADTFFNVLTSDELLASVDESAGEYRERLYPPAQTLAMFLAQALNADRSCQFAVNQLVVQRTREGLSPCSTTTGAYCRARRRLSDTMIRGLINTTGALASDRAAQVPAHGRAIKLIDGTTVSMPDTHDNQAAFPQPRTQATGVGFPIARLVAILCLHSGAVLNAGIGPYKGKDSSEHALLRTLLSTFAAGDLAIADRYYGSYFLIAALQERGVDILFGNTGQRHVDFRRGEKLGIKDHLVQWVKPPRPDWMSEEDYAASPTSLTIREVQAQGRILVTTLRCPKQMPRQSIGELYSARWHIELDLRSIKTTLGMDVLSCQSAAMVRKEILIYLLAYNLIRLLMTEAAYHTGVLARHVSFKHTVQLWLAWQTRDLIAFSSNAEQRAQLYQLIASRRVGNRPGRCEPRAVKRRAKTHALLTVPRATARAAIRPWQNAAA